MSRGTSRREFLKISTLGVAAAAGLGGPLARGAPRSAGDGNQYPGRIILYRDPAMNGHLSTIDRDRAQHGVHLGVQMLTGDADTGAAFESLFPGLHDASTIAIKVNCIGQTDTRWETARGVISGLARMLCDTYDVSQVTIFDNRDFVDRPQNPYAEEEFTFGGNCPLIINGYGNCGSHYVYENHRLSNYILDCDYLINMPALKSHNRDLNQLTLALKNHYGSCCPSDLCNNIPGMLAVNADANIKDKTCLVVMDALRGTYNGPPQEPPQTWNTFPEETPNSLFFTTDPVTNEYWGRDYINAERATHEMEPKPAPWIEEASGAPYELGVSDPGAMEVVTYDASGSSVDPEAVRGGAFLAPHCHPNPMRECADIVLRLPARMTARLRVVDAGGRLVRDFGERRYARGTTRLRWDGRDGRGRAVARGSYFLCLESGGVRRSRRVVVHR